MSHTPPPPPCVYVWFLARLISSFSYFLAGPAFQQGFSHKTPPERDKGISRRRRRAV